MAGEFGHIPLEPSGPLCGCGTRGCWEVYASNWAALRFYGGSSRANGPSFQDLLSLAMGGDLHALRALDHMAQEIGRGMRMIIAALSPEEIVFVGEFTRLWDRMGPIIERFVKESVLIGKPPRVRPASAEPSVARLRGTIAMVLQEYFGSLTNRAFAMAERALARRTDALLAVSPQVRDDLLAMGIGRPSNRRAVLKTEYLRKVRFLCSSCRKSMLADILRGSN